LNKLSISNAPNQVIISSNIDAVQSFYNFQLTTFPLK